MTTLSAQALSAKEISNKTDDKKLFFSIQFFELGYSLKFLSCSM